MLVFVVFVVIDDVVNVVVLRFLELLTVFRRNEEGLIPSFLLLFDPVVIMMVVVVLYSFSILKDLDYLLPLLCKHQKKKAVRSNKKQVANKTKSKKQKKPIRYIRIVVCLLLLFFMCKNKEDLSCGARWSHRCATSHHTVCTTRLDPVPACECFKMISLLLQLLYYCH